MSDEQMVALLALAIIIDPSNDVDHSQVWDAVSDAHFILECSKKFVERKGFQTVTGKVDHDG